MSRKEPTATVGDGKQRSLARISSYIDLWSQFNLCVLVDLLDSESLQGVPFRTFVVVGHRGNANFKFLRLPLYQSSVPRLLWYVDREVAVVGRHGCSTD